MRLDNEIVQNYRMSRTFFEVGNLISAEYYYRKNRSDHAIDLYYEVDLPVHLLFVHPVGTVLGRASYGDYLAVYQTVGVGSNLDGSRPEIGRGVVLFPGAKVIGDTKIGDNVFVQANTVVHNKEIPSNSIVYPHNGGCANAPIEANVIRDVFKVQL